jgi:hypothetical protein
VNTVRILQKFKYVEGNGAYGWFYVFFSNDNLSPTYACIALVIKCSPTHLCTHMYIHTYPCQRSKQKLQPIGQGNGKIGRMRAQRDIHCNQTRQVVKKIRRQCFQSI